MKPGFLGFDLLRPELLPLFLAAPAVLAIAVIGLAARRRARLRLVAQRHQGRFLPRFSENRARLRVALATAAVLLIGLAALGPVRGYTLREVHRRGVDLVVCVDTSRSMLVQDLKPDRLSRAKREVTGLLQRLAGDRVALLAFAGDVRRVAPLTHDRATLALFVDDLSPEENLRGGTDIGGVLDAALELFDGRTGAHEAVVLITDGEDLEGHGLEVAKRAAEKGIRIYVVGMATEAGGKIPDGRGFVRDESGAEVVSRLGTTSLEEIAAATGGAFLSAESSPIPLEELYDKRIARLEGRDLWAGKERVPHDRFQWPLCLAVACMLCEAGLRERRGGERARARRASKAAALLIGFSALAPGRAVAQAPGAAAQEPRAAAQQPWKGSFAAGLAEVERLSDAGDADAAASVADRMLVPSAFLRWRAERDEGFVRAALELADPLLDLVGASGLSSEERAAVHYAKGVALARALDAESGAPSASGAPGAPPPDDARAARRAAADAAFETTRGLAGAGELRLDAIYDLGTLDLAEGERLRALLPEHGGAQPAPQVPVPPVPPGPAAAEKDPDADIGLARAAYGAALEHFVERLREDWRDADTRADVELVQRRLRELDEIERKREQDRQNQEQQDQQKGQQPKDQGEPSDQQKKDQQKKDEQDQKDPQDKDPGQDQPKDEPPKEPEQEPEPSPEDQQSEKKDDASEPKEGEERLLTREEMMRLLQRLAEIEREGERVQAQLRSARRAKTKKDW